MLGLTRVTDVARWCRAVSVSVSVSPCVRCLSRGPSAARLLSTSASDASNMFDGLSALPEAPLKRTIVVTDPSDTADAVQALLESTGRQASSSSSSSSSSSHVVLGFDTESKPGDKVKSYPTSLIQFSSNDVAVLLHVAQWDPDADTPSALVDLMSDPSVLKVGQAIRPEVAQLSRELGIPMSSMCGMVDTEHLGRRLVQLLRSAGEEPLYDGRSGLKYLCARYLEKAMNKPKSIQRSNWARRLSRRQKAYAALDAWVSRAVFLEMVDEYARLTGAAARHDTVLDDDDDDAAAAGDSGPSLPYWDLAVHSKSALQSFSPAARAPPEHCSHKCGFPVSASEWETWSDDSPISYVIEYCQARRVPLPEFDVVERHVDGVIARATIRHSLWVVSAMNASPMPRTKPAHAAAALALLHQLPDHGAFIASKQRQVLRRTALRRNTHRAPPGGGVPCPPKSQLVQWCQVRKLPGPQFDTRSAPGGQFVSTVTVHGVSSTSSAFPSKRAAEHDAAATALKQLT